MNKIIEIAQSENRVIFTPESNGIPAFISVKEFDGETGFLYWQTSRGTAPRDHVFPPVNMELLKHRIYLVKSRKNCKGLSGFM